MSVQCEAGLRLEFQEFEGSWYGATVIEVGQGTHANQLKVKLDGWASAREDWIPKTSKRLRLPGAKHGRVPWDMAESAAAGQLGCLAASRTRSVDPGESSPAANSGVPGPPMHDPDAHIQLRSPKRQRVRQDEQQSSDREGARPPAAEHSPASRQGGGRASRPPTKSMTSLLSNSEHDSAKMNGPGSSRTERWPGTDEPSRPTSRPTFQPDRDLPSSKHDPRRGRTSLSSPTGLDDPARSHPGGAGAQNVGNGESAQSVDARQHSSSLASTRSRSDRAAANTMGGATSGAVGGAQSQVLRTKECTDPADHLTNDCIGREEQKKLLFELLCGVSTLPAL